MTNRRCCLFNYDSRSLMDMYEYIKITLGLPIITYRLNQDPLDHLFGKLRGKGGFNDHPTPFDFKGTIIFNFGEGGFLHNNREVDKNELFPRYNALLNQPRDDDRKLQYVHGTTSSTGPHVICEGFLFLINEHRFMDRNFLLMIKDICVAGFNTLLTMECRIDNT